MRILALGVGAVLAFSRAAAATDFSELESLAISELRRANVPGCAIAVVVDGRLAFAKGVGIANVDTREPVRADMLFRLGSTTKIFTAATVVTLAENGRTPLDASVGRVVPGLAPKIARATLHQLLSHSAGLADDAPMEGPHDESALGVTCRALRDNLAFTGPGKVYSYSNPGFWLAGLAAETAGAKPYAELVAERVLRPCGMVRSTFRPTVAMTWPLAVGHDAPEGKPPAVIRPLADNAGTWPAGQLFSSAPEFARFCIALMDEGRLDGRSVLPAAVVSRLTTPQVAQAGGEGHYAYGLGVRDQGGLRWWSHTGSRAGYGSIVRMCPEKKFAVIVLCNRTGQHLPRVAEKAAALVLGAAPPPRVVPQKLPMNADEMARIAGTYTNGRTTVALRVRDGQLVGAQGGVWTKTGEDRYTRSAFGNSPATEFIFTTGFDGSDAYLVRTGRALARTDPPSGSATSLSP